MSIKKCYPAFVSVFALVAIIMVGGCSSAKSELSPQLKVMADEGRAYYQNKCKTTAGEKIYRSVVDVEGIFLMKIRPFISENQLKDPMWPGAAFALEFYDDSYISSFLDYEYATKNIDGSINSITKDRRGYTKPEKRPGARPGYRFVDVVEAKNGYRYRVTRVIKEVDHIRSYDSVKFKSMDYLLDKKPTEAAPPRYGVTYEDHVIPEERAIGVASSTVKVIDLETNEVLGEMKRYAYRPRGLHFTDWLTSERCPNHAVGVNSATRKFVDQVLIPKGE